MICFSAFDTPVGPCGIAWRRHIVVGTALPAATHDALLGQLGRRFGGGEEATPPASIARLIARIGRLLSGEAETFADIEVDLTNASTFERRVYAETSAIPPGETRTYGQLAQALGEPGAARAVGRALGRNPVPILVPCHRVLAADGRSGGFTAPGGVRTKMKLLAIERARTGAQPSLFDLPWAVRS